METSPVLIKTLNKTIEIICEVANNSQTISHGLMGRKIMPADDGMIFLFPYSQKSNFWMLNTYIPLSIAFFDENGKIIDIQDMQPNTLDPHAPASEFKGALEMNQGWFERHNINIGDYITVPKSSYPLMLNEKIYYADDVAEAKHDGLSLEYEEGSTLLPWDEVDNSLIEKIYPRFPIPEKFSNSFSKSSSDKSTISLEDSPGLERFLSIHGIEEFHKRNMVLQQKFGVSYEDLVNNLHLFTQDLEVDRDGWGEKERERAREWYPDEPVRVVEKAKSLGFRPETTSAILARLSPSTQWLESSEERHIGNRDETIKLLQTVRTLMDSGIQLDKPVKDKQNNIVIPKGKVDLDLTPEQIASLPNLTKNKKTIDSFRVLSAELAKSDLTGSPIDFLYQTAHKNLEKVKGPGDPAKQSMLQAPKMTNFYYVILKKTHPNTDVIIPEDNMVIDRHMVNAAFNKSIYGTTEFKKVFESKSNKTPIIYDLIHSAILDARHRSNNKLQHEEYQAFLWNGYLARNKKGKQQKQSIEFVQSPRNKLFIPSTHFSDNTTCDLDSLHDFLD